MTSTIVSGVLDLAIKAIDLIVEEPELFSADEIEKAIELVQKRQALHEAKEIAALRDR
ncbi:MAG: hypothetical protein QNJ16_18305 [Rhodobacter sp.]|nr:hypothetical protein [Rhodobacter sp.]